MEHTTHKPFSWMGVLGRAGLALAGIVLALLLVWGILSAFPQLLPQDLRDPLEQRSANQVIEVRYHETDGDLFFHMKGMVKPPENPALLSAHVFETDENGFRVPAMRLDSYADYPVVVLGDSFTDAWMAAQPWPDVLAQNLDAPVLNLAYRGYGTLEEAAVMEEYGGGRHQWVLIGFFEGNDLMNISRTFLEQDGGNLLTNLVREAVAPEDFEVVESPDGNYPYPLALYIGADFYELAFYDFYIWILNADRDVYDQSNNMAEFKNALGQIISASGDSCVGVVYIPEKAHIYFRYAEPFGRRWILENGLRTELDDEGWIARSIPETTDFDTLLSRMDNQRDSVQAAVATTSAHFIDLTPAFEEAAEQSEMLYLTYDTHWNQAGHELAAQVMADYLRDAGECTLEE